MTSYSSTSTMAEIQANPDALELVEQYMPGITEHEFVRTTPGARLAVVSHIVPWRNDISELEELTELLSQVPYRAGEEQQEPEWPAPPAEVEPDAVRASAPTRAPSAARVHRTAEIELTGPDSGNPFVDVHLSAQVIAPSGTRTVLGFYDGAGVYRLRFLPLEEGRHRILLRSNARSLDRIEVGVDVASAAPEDRGPVTVQGFGFRYSDGSRFLPLGTTCYAWTHQGEEREQQTLRSLARAPFRKVRMCVFPKSMVFNENEPEFFPYAPSDASTISAGITRAGAEYDRQRFEPAAFRHLERRIVQLGELGIEADVIVFHPYDRWGLSRLGAQADELYIRYLVARLGALPNVWWSLANEYDLVADKTDEEWTRLGELFATLDAYDHPRSIHQCGEVFDHAQPWITHASLQKADGVNTPETTIIWRQRWGKPVILDEMGYEGDIEHSWGNLTAQEMVRRFWDTAVRGGWGGHGETYANADDVLWWSKGGQLSGESVARISFLAAVLDDAPDDLEPIWTFDSPLATAGDSYRLWYSSGAQPSQVKLVLPPGEWDLEVLDTWEMSCTPLDGPHTGTVAIRLPGRPYTAVRMRRRASGG